MSKEHNTKTEENEALPLTPFQQLVQVIKRLRDPDTGCPWDKAQTHQSLKKNLIEESYEVLDAIDALSSNDSSSEPLKKELGDLLLQVMLHSQIAHDNGTFSIDDVISQLNDKLIRRHPHIFGNSSATTPAEALENWEKSKSKERKADESILSGVPLNMPALLRAQRVSEKAAHAGFEWSTLEAIGDQVLDEVREFVVEYAKDTTDGKAIADEFGDILFSLVQMARRLNLDAEDLLQQSNNKFIKRFTTMEKIAGKPIDQLKLAEMNQLWGQVKKMLSQDQ